MTTILFNVISLSMIALVLFGIRSCNTTIKMRRIEFVFLFAFMFLAHFTLCWLDSYDRYSGWINLLFAAMMVRFFWSVAIAKRNNYNVDITFIKVVLMAGFAITYILLGLLAISYVP